MNCQRAWYIGGVSHLWLYISVGDIQFVKGDKAFQKLTGNPLRVFDRTGAGVFEVVGQVTMLNIFHCDEDEVAIRVPAEEFDKEILALRFVRPRLHS